MKNLLILLILFSFISSVSCQSDARGHRLIILADMGNEPDEEQQMMHMLMCCNEFELEGLIAVTGKYLQPASNNPYKQKIHPELFHHLIEGYEKVYKNLLKHAPGYHEPEYLRNIVASGQTGYGIADTGEGRSTEGSRLIVKSLENEDPGLLYFVVNAGSNTLAQALIDFQSSHTDDELSEAIAKIRVFENGAQDNAGAWICANFPEIHWIRSNYQTYCYGGPSNDGAADNSGNFMDLGPHTWQPYAYSTLGQHQWALEHIISDHGPFGMYWPLRQFDEGRISFLEGGGTVPWLGLVNKGLYDIDNPWWGGWSGRFSRDKNENYWSKHTSVKVDENDVAPFYMYIEGADTWINPDDGQQYDGINVPVWRWRQAFYNDFTCRMDWCKQSYENANHHPVAALNGDNSDNILIMEVAPGEKVFLDASDTKDPDGDELVISWWYYPEAGTYKGEPGLSDAVGQKTSITIPQNASGSEIHIILEVKDLSDIASLWDYRRVVFKVQ